MGVWKSDLPAWKGYPSGPSLMLLSSLTTHLSTIIQTLPRLGSQPMEWSDCQIMNLLPPFYGVVQLFKLWGSAQRVSFYTVLPELRISGLSTSNSRARRNDLSLKLSEVTKLTGQCIISKCSLANNYSRDGAVTCWICGVKPHVRPLRGALYRNGLLQ